MKNKAHSKIKQWRRSPYLFVTEVLRANPIDSDRSGAPIKVVTTQQKQVLDDLGDLVHAKKKLELGKVLTSSEKILVKKTGISIKSGKGSGKTALLSWIVIWFLVLFKEALIPCTAGKLDQVKDVLWREISKWIKRSSESGLYKDIVVNTLVVQGEKIYVKGASVDKSSEGKDWYAVARSASTTKSSNEPAETLQGFHSKNMMIVVDEATGVSDNVFAPLDQTLTDPCNFIIMTYNPTRTSGFAYRSQHRDKNEWLTYRWNCEESENVSKESIERVARKYGIDSNAYRISVLGLEPVGDSDAVIPLEWVMKAVNRDIVPCDDDPLISCVDLARQGDDKSVILSRKGMVIDKDIRTFNGQNTMEMAGWVSAFISEEEPTCVGIDVIGMGYGVYDRLREIGHRITSINVAESTSRKEKFDRLRDELWWKAREAFEAGVISIPDDEELIFELSNVKYKIESSGKIKVESKREMRKRGVQSPNKADSVVMTFYFNDASYRERMEEDRYSKKESEFIMNNSFSDSWMVA